MIKNQTDYIKFLRLFLLLKESCFNLVGDYYYDYKDYIILIIFSNKVLF